ncbi:CP3A5-like protein [Mya arenaria]|uniref:CP3A5-like protein n=1 Tax=Mya arenaria TaxID=6604 RepID=A0ABY7ETR8_MYAAR|nr:CP3A5-like protein [Mya arenaria]
MEILGLLDIPGCLLVPVGLIMALCLYSWHKQSYFRRLGLPTKPTTLILGDMPLQFKKGFGYIDVESIQKYGKVFGTYLGSCPSLVVADADIIKHIMVKDFSNFTDRKALFPVGRQMHRLMNLAEGKYWRLLRTSFSAAFTSGKIRPMSSYISRCLVRLEKNVVKQNEEHPDGFDINPLVKSFTMDVILNVGFGVEVDAQNNPDNPYVRHAYGFLKFSGKNLLFILFLLFPEISMVSKFFNFSFIPEESRQFFRSASRALIEDRRSEKQPETHRDLLQLLIDAKDKSDQSDGNGEQLTDEDIIGNSNVFMIAGFDTTASTLSWLVYDLVTHPDIQDKLIAEIDEKLAGEEPNYDNVFGMSYLDMVVSETLRMHPVAPKLIRQGSQPMEICGVRIPEGIEIHIPVTTLHFMPEYWEQPEVYNPERCRCLSLQCLSCGLGHRCSLPWKPGTGTSSDTNRVRGQL